MVYIYIYILFEQMLQLMLQLISCNVNRNCQVEPLDDSQGAQFLLNILFVCSVCMATHFSQ